MPSDEPGGLSKRGSHGVKVVPQWVVGEFLRVP